MVRLNRRLICKDCRRGLNTSDAPMITSFAQSWFCRSKLGVRRAFTRYPASLHGVPWLVFCGWRLWLGEPAAVYLGGRVTTEVYLFHAALRNRLSASLDGT